MFLVFLSNAHAALRCYALGLRRTAFDVYQPWPKLRKGRYKGITWGLCYRATGLDTQSLTMDQKEAVGP